MRIDVHSLDSDFRVCGWNGPMGLEMDLSIFFVYTGGGLGLWD